MREQRQHGRAALIRRLAVAAFAWCSAWGCGAAPGLPYYTDASRTPRWLDASPARLRAVHRVGDFSLVDQAGRVVSRRDVAGKVYVASFFYTACQSLCPTVRSELARVQDTFRGDSGVVLLSHTVTPEHDDAAALAHYAHLNGMDPRKWRLLTGSRTEIERLARDRYFVEVADSSGYTSGELRHTETLVLVDGDGHIRGMYSGSLAYEVDQLIADIRALRSGGS